MSAESGGHPRPEAKRFSLLETPGWVEALAVNAVMRAYAPGLSRLDLDPVEIRAFPPVRHLRVDRYAPSTGGRVGGRRLRLNDQQFAKRRRKADEFLGLPELPR
jgi:hypothetical protein